MEYYVLVPKRFKSCKWNHMRVTIIEEDTTHAITVNKNGKKLRFYKAWLRPITKEE